MNPCRLSVRDYPSNALVSVPVGSAYLLASSRAVLGVPSRQRLLVALAYLERG
jgi:hypothetical protein